MFYEEKGVGEPVVFVHGTLCDYRGWSAQTKALSSSYRTIAYSRRYAFPNEREGDLSDSSVEKNSEDLKLLIDGLVGGKVHLVGHSFGGFIAAYFAATHPETIFSLTLANAAVGTMIVRDNSALAAVGLLFKYPTIVGSARRLQNGTKEAIRAVDAGDVDAIRRVFLPSLENRRKDLPPKSEEFLAMAKDNARTPRENITPFPHLNRSDMMRLRLPCLVAWGNLSAPWDLKISQTLVLSVPGAVGARIDGAGHFCMNDKPDEFNSRLSEFLQKHPTGHLMCCGLPQREQALACFRILEKYGPVGARLGCPEDVFGFRL